ncbi:MAG: AAA family ATPase [Verrucomicrobia bacterium]|nr:AAA family ATPase [Verrucomicrobiota bacterium]
MNEAIFTPEKMEEAEKLKEALAGLPSGSEIRITTADDIISEELPKPEYLIDGLLERNDLFFFTGKSKSGKSTCIINMAVALASGIPFAGRHCKPCNVLLISLEDKESTVKRRAKDCMHGWNVNPGNKLGFVFRNEMLKYTLGGNKTNLEALAEILQNDKLKSLTGRPLNYYDVIIVDPLYYLAEAMDENNSKEMGKLARDVRNLGAGRTMIVTAHSTKGDISNKEAEEGISGSGISGRIGEAYVLLVPHEKEGHIIARFKLRNERNPKDEVWSLNDYPRLNLAPDEDPTAYKKTGRAGGTSGRPKVFTEEMILNLFPDFKTEIKAADLWDICAKKHSMSKSTAEGLIRQLKNNGELENQNGKYKRKFTANENM